MIIQIGEIFLDNMSKEPIIYPNKARKYLLPCLKEYGEQFTRKLSNVFKIAVGIGDMIVVNSIETKYERHLFILLETTIAEKFFIEFIDWIREQPMYQDDYVYDNIQKSSSHMIVIKFPEKYYDSFTTFKEGKYSEMFKDPKTFDYFKSYPEVTKILVKDHNYKISFIRDLNTEYLLRPPHDIKPVEWEGELDKPPTDITEVFNHHLKNR